MIRSIFPLNDFGEEESKDPSRDITVPQSSVIGFKLAKTTDDCQSVQIYLTQITPEEDSDESEQLFQLYMLLESTLPRYSNVFAQRKPLAQKIGLQLVTCFCNLETFLNLEFETGK